MSGKGDSAALLMAKLSGEVRYCLASERTPAAAMNRINAAFCRGWDDRFVSFILAVLDRARHEVTIVNAGHMPPLLRHAAARSNRWAMPRRDGCWVSMPTSPISNAAGPWRSAIR